MNQTNFTPIGKIPGQYIFVHKDDLQYLHPTIHSDIIKCVAIDFETLQISVPVVINELFVVCPYYPIETDTEREDIINAVLKIFPQRTINRLKDTFNKIKYR
jgi:hypothetical protein